MSSGQHIWLEAVAYLLSDPMYTTLGMIQQLRNAVVAPTGMGKNYGRIMPLLRQGWLVRQKIMHYGFLDNASQDAFAAKRKHPNCSQYYFFGRFPWAL